MNSPNNGPVRKKMPTKGPWTWVVVGGLIVVAALLFWWRGYHSPSDPLTTVTDKATALNAKPVPGSHTSTRVVASDVARSAVTVLDELRGTYRPGGVPARIRLQGELSDRWDKQPPTSAEVVNEISDPAAPADHRVYIAHSFRNLAKMNRFEAKETAEVLVQMLEIVADEKDESLVRGQLAVVVAGFDKSPTTVQAIAPLLNDANDDAGALAVTALRHTATDVAATVLYEYLQRDAANRDAKPKTTVSALMALTGYGKLDIVPIAKEIVTQTQSMELFRGALFSLSEAPSSSAVVEALVTAYTQSERFVPVAPIWVKDATVRALKVHAHFVATQLQVPLGTTNPVILRASQIINSSER